jgi:hypothetical protein
LNEGIGDALVLLQALRYPVDRKMSVAEFGCDHDKIGDGASVVSWISSETTTPLSGNRPRHETPEC